MSVKNLLCGQLLQFQLLLESKSDFAKHVLILNCPREGRGVLLGILGGGVPLGSPNPDPISNEKKFFCHTRFQALPLKSIPARRVSS